MFANIFFVAFLAVFCCGSAHDNKKMKEISDKCLQKLELELETFDEWYHKRPVETDNPKYKCYFECLLKEIKWMDEDGNILEKPEIEVEEEFARLGSECRDEIKEGEGDCDKAFNFHKCIIEKKEKD